MDFRKEFQNKIEELYPNGLEWGIVGILVKKGFVYTLSYDSKILSGVFEILCEPIIRNIADSNNIIMEKTAQNAYPDFTLYKKTEKDNKIAVEVKSTYRQFNKEGKLKPFGFTLGSYKSYLKDPIGCKGILFPYDEYIEHWVIGFLYSRNPKCTKTEIRQIIEAGELETPFIDIEYFIQHKYLIAGKKPGSGNTTNIGSFKSRNIEDFKDGKGPFNTKEEFEKYWRSY
ncbi:type II restriction endonuclease [bacterium]|nr:type II restriction endonuclease [bacterium]